jgi:hypothetical protein
MRRRDVGRAITGAVGDGIKTNIGPALDPVGSRLGDAARGWSGSVVGALTDGRIFGAVNTTVGLVDSIGGALGVNTDAFSSWAGDAAGKIDSVGAAINAAGGLKDTLVDVGGLLGDVLPGKAGAGAQKITAALGAISAPQWLMLLISGGAAAATAAGARERINDAGALRAPQVDAGGNRTNAPSPPQAPTPGAQITPSQWIGQAQGEEERRRRDAEIRSRFGGYNDQWFQPFTPPWGAGAPNRVQPRAAGGPVSGPGGTDNVLSWLTAGEFVINKQSVDRLQATHPGLLDMLNRYDSGGLVAGAQELRRIITERFGISNIGGWRPADKYGEHSTGRALDVMVGNNQAKGDAIKDFVLDNASALDLKWVIWRQHLYYPGGGGHDMPNRGNPTQNHMDHVHIFSGPGITNGLLGALKSKPKTQIDTRGAITPGSVDQTAAVPAAVGAATPAGVASSGGLSMPSSISGLAGWGFDAMGSGAKNQAGNRDPMAYFGPAAGAAISGQVASALGVFGIGDSPPWLQAASKFVSGISVSRTGSATPTAATPLMTGPPDIAPMSSSAGQQPGITYNIAARDTEDAFIRAQRKERERAAARLERF